MRRLAAPRRSFIVWEVLLWVPWSEPLWHFSPVEAKVKGDWVLLRSCFDRESAADLREFCEYKEGGLVEIKMTIVQ